MECDLLANDLLKDITADQAENNQPQGENQVLHLTCENSMLRVYVGDQTSPIRRDASRVALRRDFNISS